MEEFRHLPQVTKSVKSKAVSEPSIQGPFHSITVLFVGNSIFLFWQSELQSKILASYITVS